MIRKKNTLCMCCGAISTRRSVDEDGTPLPLCSRCPSPQEIEAAAARIRLGWSEEELLMRSLRMTSIVSCVRFRAPCSVHAASRHRVAEVLHD